MYDSGPYVGVTDEDLQPVSVADYFKQSWNDGRRVANMSARALNLTEAFDEVNDKIAKATGVKDLANPLQGDVGLFQPARRPEQAPAPGAIDKQPLDIWKDRVRELQKLHPDALPWDQIIDEPGRKALERMKSIREESGALDDRAGMAQAIQRPELGWVDKIYSPSEQFIENMIRRPDLAVAGLGGSFAAAMTSPVDAAVNLIGFGAGGKAASLAKNMLINAAVNTVGQAPLSAFKQLQYKEAGLPYGWDQWSREVAGAGVAGGIIDVSVRAPARAVRAVRGTADGQGGIFTDAPKAIPLPEQPKARPAIPTELLDRARADDLEAIKEVARLSGVDEDPAVKGAIHYAETTGPIDEAIAQRFREMGIDDGEGLRVLADALRGDRYVRPPEPVAAAEPRLREAGEKLLLDREPDLQALITGLDQRLQQRIVDAVEAGIPRVVNIVQERLDAKGDPVTARETLVADLAKVADDLGGPERFNAMVDLYAGRGDIRMTAEAIRNFPDLVDEGLAGSGLIQGARAIAKLEPEAFERFRAGEVSPGVARAVSDMVPPDQQARVMDDMRRAGVETEADARGIVGDLVKPTRDASDADTPLSRGSKIDDPAGPEAAKQTEILAKELAEALKEAEAPIKARDKLETQMDAKLGEIAKIEEKAAKAAGKEDAKGDDIPEHLFAMTADEVDAKPKPKGARQKIRLEGGPLSEAEGSVARGRLKHFAQSVIDQYETWREAGGDAEYRQMLLEQRRDDNEQNLKDYSGVPFHYDIIGPDGKAVGRGVEGVVIGRTMVIDWIGGYGHENALGVGVLKDLREQVRKDFPKVNTFIGYRVSGARAAADAENRIQKVKLFALSDKDIAAIGEKHAEYRDLQAQHLEASRGSPLFALVMDRVAQQRSRDVRQAVEAALRTADKILPESVKVDVRTEEMRDPTTGNRLEATSNTRTGDIELAAYALNPAARLGHEAVHTLVTRGLLSPKEVATLAKAAREAGTFTKEADYREAYKDRADLDRLIEEEAAAHYVEAVIARRVEPTIPRNLIQKLQQIIERIRNALNGYGLRIETDVVRAIMEGDAAARRSVQAWMRSADMGAVAVDKAKGRVFALGGEKAQTANLDALAQAKQYETAGMDRDNIWKLTGWGRGADGKWRFEIDDSDAGFSARQSVKRESGQMGDRFEHPELYDAYPALRALDLFWDHDMDPKINLGGFKPDEGVVSLAATMPSQWTLPVLLHELQHGVQEMERFARGGSMAEFEVAPARVQGWLTGEDAAFIKGTYFERDITMSAAKVIDGFDGGDLADLRYQVMQLVERGEISLEAAARKIAQQMQTDGYTRLAGEVEARLVEHRMDMTPEQRRERPFWYDYDVLEQEQDVRRRDVMYAMADDRKLKAWHASENDIDTFAMGPRGRTAGGQEYPGASSFALRRGVSGPDGEWTKAVRAEFGVDPRVYEVEIDTGGLVLDVRKPFGQQSKEVQDYLRANAQRIRAEWPQNLDYMTFSGVPADMQKPEHYAAFLVNTKRGDRAAAEAEAEQRLTNAGSKKEKKLLTAVKSAIQKRSDPEPDLFNQHTLSKLYGTGWSGGPKSPLEFGVIIGGDEVVVLDHSRVRIISKDGEPVERGNMMFAMAPERKARAEAMGFDTSTVWYHGTRRGKFDAFDKDEVGSNFAADERGFFFINDPKQASEYATSDTTGLPASDGSVIPAYLKTKKPLIIDDMFLKREGMQPIGKTEDVISFWDNYQGLILEWADKQKADAVVLVDNSYRQKGPNAGQPTMMMVVFDPTQIRSVNAAFDPAKADSPNLMYAMEHRTPLQDDMEAISRLDAFKELVEACR